MKINRVPFDLQEDEFIRQNYLQLSTHGMSFSLNRSRSGVMIRMKALGLKLQGNTKNNDDQEITPMEKGQRAILIPGKHNSKMNGSSAHQSRVADILRSMTEEVTIVKVDDSTGNTKVRDKNNLVFYCNTNDLRPF